MDVKLWGEYGTAYLCKWLCFVWPSWGGGGSSEQNCLVYSNIGRDAIEILLCNKLQIPLCKWISWLRRISEFRMVSDTVGFPFLFRTYIFIAGLIFLFWIDNTSSSIPYCVLVFKIIELFTTCVYFLYSHWLLVSLVSSTL